MRIRFTLFLLIANLVVFGLIWNNARVRNRERPPAELVFPINADRITLTDATDPTASYSLSLKSGVWNLEKPFDWPANAWTVQNILDKLRFVSREGGFSLGEAASYGNNASSYGLDNPRFALTVSAGGVDTAVKIGSLTPDGRGVFLLLPDAKTVLPTDKSVFTALVRPPADLRQPEVFSIQPFAVNAISLTMSEAGQETRVGLVRAPGNAWRFETPVASDADSPVVEKELAALTDLKYRRFLPPAAELPEKYGLTTPAMRISLVGGNRRRTLLVGAPDAEEKSPHRYAKFEDNPAVFTIASESLRPWENARREMREHHFMRFDPATLSGITVHSGGRSLVLHRLDAPAGAGKSAAAKPEWHMPVVAGSTATVALPVDADRLAELQNALSNLTARDFGTASGTSPEGKALCAAFVTDEPTPEQLRAWGFEKPEKVVDLAFLDGTKRTLIIAPPVAPDTHYHAKLASSPTVYSIANALPARLSVRPDAYRRRTLYTMPAGSRLMAIKITDLSTGKAVLDERKPDDVPDWASWLESRPKREREEVIALADRCRELRAERFMETPFSRDFRYDTGDGRPASPWRYRVEWSVKLPAGADVAKVETRTLLVTRRIGGTEQIAGSEADSAVFSLSQEWVDALFPVTFGRDGVGAPPPTPAPAPAAPAPALSAPEAAPSK